MSAALRLPTSKRDPQANNVLKSEDPRILGIFQNAWSSYILVSHSNS